MATLVTGGTGLVGINLVRALVAKGERVRVLVRPNSKRVGLESPNIEFRLGDVCDLDSIRRAMRGCTRVYHVAGWVQLSPWGMRTARAVNVGGAENICLAALDLNIERVVHTSSVAAIGHGPMDRPADEQSRWNLAGLNCPYFATKRDGERVVLDYVGRGLDAVIVNPGYVVGPYDVKPTSGRMILLGALGKLLFYPSRGGIGFVDVAEVVEGMQLAMSRGRCGERYILSNENLSYQDFAGRIARIAGVTPPRWSAPYWLGIAPAGIATMLGALWPEPFVELNLTVLRTCFCEHYTRADKARRELGLKPRSIDGAIAAAIDWFQSFGYIERTPSGWARPK